MLLSCFFSGRSNLHSAIVGHIPYDVPTRLISIRAKASLSVLGLVVTQNHALKGPKQHSIDPQVRLTLAGVGSREREGRQLENREHSKHKPRVESKLSGLGSWRDGSVEDHRQNGADSKCGQDLGRSRCFG